MIDFIKNLDFEKITIKGKPVVVAGLCLAFVFVCGFGSGRLSGPHLNNGVNNSTSSSISPRTLNNYTTKTGANATNDTANTTETTNTQTTNTKSIDQENCPVKGSKSKIYHIQGGSFYNRTTAVQCFNTEDEALSAGFTKSSR